MDNITKYISEITYTYSFANVIGNRDREMEKKKVKKEGGGFF